MLAAQSRQRFSHRVGVGRDRHRLVQRQRLAVARCACSREQNERRSARQIVLADLAGRELSIDGFNVLVTIESALASGMILLGRDGCCRDMASVHGTYREVAETTTAASLVGKVTAAWGVAACRWTLDRPVGNSGRLKATLEAVAAEAGWPWEVAVELSPDRVLSAAAVPIVSSDSLVQDRCECWCNVARAVIAANTHKPSCWICDRLPATDRLSGDDQRNG